MSSTTKEKLLNSALDIFAESGFKSTTVQQIASRAGANISAINYHFGNKANFYAEAVVHHIKQSILNNQDGDEESSSPESRLRNLIKQRITIISKDKPPMFIEKILMQEMANPGPVMDKMVEHFIRPEFNKLTEIMEELLPDDCTESEIRRHSFSVIGQCNFYLHAQPILSRICPNFEINQNETEQLVDHITSVCLAAVAAEHEKHRKI